MINKVGSDHPGAASPMYLYKYVHTELQLELCRYHMYVCMYVHIMYGMHGEAHEACLHTCVAGCVTPLGFLFGRGKSGAVTGGRRVLGIWVCGGQAAYVLGDGPASTSYTDTISRAAIAATPHNAPQQWHLLAVREADSSLARRTSRSLILNIRTLLWPAASFMPCLGLA